MMKNLKAMMFAMAACTVFSTAAAVPAMAAVPTPSNCILSQNVTPSGERVLVSSSVAELNALDERFHDIASHAKRSTVVFAERFPFRYLTHAYGWDYYAAFSGCSSDTDASAATLSFLIQKVRDENIQTVFYLENSSQKISDAVCKATGAKAVMLQSCNNVSKADFQSRKHYQEFMRENLAAIREALS